MSCMKPSGRIFVTDHEIDGRHGKDGRRRERHPDQRVGGVERID